MMTDRRWLLLIAAAGIAIFALSFVDGWLVHERELRGEGYRFVETSLNAWRGRAMPVLTVGVVAALLVGALAAVAAWRPGSVPAAVLLIGAVVTLGLLLSGAWPIAQDGHASSVRVSAGPLLGAGAVLALLMVAGGIALRRPARSLVVATAAAGLLLVGAGAGGRWLGLQWAEGTGQHWSEGSYTRPATGDAPALTLTIGDGRFTIGDRWSGTWEASGWTVVLDDDPACPDSRGTYHAHAEGDDDLRFVKVVDTCRDGERAAELETGIWERDAG